MGLRRPTPNTPHMPGLSRLTPLATGGFATVYEAWQESLGRKVAVKVLHERDPDQSMLRRFHEECRLAGTLSHHPNVVPLYSSGFEASVGPYLVMELMPGGTLRDRLGRGTSIPRDDALRIFAEVAGALESAHRRGIVHGDVKPENILFDAFGRARLGDFGIARISASASTGTVAATIRYAAPEVLEGAAPSASSDVFSLACVAGELLTGHHPFVAEGASNTAAVASILRGDVRPEVGAGSGATDQPLRRALSVGAGQRPASAGVFAAEIAEAAQAEGTTMPALVVLDVEPDTGVEASMTEVVLRRPPRRRRLVLAAALAVVVVLLAIGTVVLRSRGDATDTVSAADAGEARPPTVDKDGRLSYAFPTSESGELRIARKWLYDPGAEVLSNEVTITSVSGGPVQQSVDEVIPKEIAADVSELTFDPPPGEVVRADPIVRFQVDLPAEGSTVLRWSASVGPLDADGLAALAAARDAAEAEHLTLAGGEVVPGGPGGEVAQVSATTTAPPDAVVGGPGRPRPPVTTAPPTSSVDPVATTAAPQPPPPGEPTTTAIPPRAPGDVGSFVARDPIPENFVGGIPQQIRLTFDWTPPADDGGQAATSYRLRCTAMQESRPYDGGPAPCRGGVEVSRPAGTSRSTTILIDRLEPALSWIKWEIAAVNDGGTGGYRTAQVRVPNVVGMFSWEAFPVGRAVGLMVGGDKEVPCGQSKNSICRQSIAASGLVASGAHFALASNP